MKQAFKNILISVSFLLGFFILLFILSRFAVPKNNMVKNGIPKDEERAYGVLAEKKDSLDALILGDSCAYSAINPIQMWNDYGFASYCISTPGQKVCYTEYLFNMVIKRQTPKLVIFEADTFFREYGYANKFAFTMYKILPIIQYHDRWKSLVLKDLDIFSDPEYTNRIDSKGYYYCSDVVPTTQEPGFAINSSDRFGEVIDYKTKNAVKGMVERCHAKGAKVVFVSVPCLSNYSDKRHQQVVDFAKSLDVEYKDLNQIEKDIGVDWTVDSRDAGDHLNYTGATKVTKWLGKYIKDMDILPDRRTDKDYDDWNKSYENFMETVKADQAEKSNKEK